MSEFKVENCELFNTAKNIIVKNIEKCGIKVQNASNIMHSAVKTHDNLQKLKIEYEKISD